MNKQTYTQIDILTAISAIKDATIDIEHVDSGFCPSLILPDLNQNSSNLLLECIPFYDQKINKIVIKNHSRMPIILSHEEDARAIARNEKVRLQKLFYFKSFRLTGLDIKKQETNTSFSPTIKIRKKKD